MNLLDRGLTSITREPTENACSADFKRRFHSLSCFVLFACLHFLIIVFFFLTSNLVSTLPRLFWGFDTFMDKVLSTGESEMSFALKPGMPFCL